MPRAIVFDLGNVLVFFDHRRAAERLLAHGLKSVELFMSKAYGLEEEYLLDCGRMSADEYVDWAMKRFKLTCDRSTFAEIFADVFTPNPSMLANVARLQGKFPLALASNTNALHRPGWEKVLADHGVAFDVEVTSDKAGFRKPERGFYLAAQKALGFEAKSEVWFFDDLEANVASARDFGWRAWPYVPGGPAEALVAGL